MRARRPSRRLRSRVSGVRVDVSDVHEVGMIFGERTVLFFLVFPMKARTMVMVLMGIEVLMLLNQTGNAMVLGGHGDTMVPVRSSCTIAGIPVLKFLDEKTLEAIETRTRKAGGEVVGLLGFGSAFVSPAWAALEMAEAIIFDKRKILPVCAKLEGEYGVNGLFVGVPAIVGANGVEEVIEIDLTDDEKAAFAHSVEAVSKTCGEVDGMLANI